MISPSKQKIIQIDITNACPHSCSNCTRFVGHHKKPFFMGLSQFKNALKSLAGYQGMIGIMGGEPTLHPDFDKILDLLPKLGRPDFLPIKNFADYRKYKLASINNKIGLWTSLGNKYYDNYEAIQDTFPYQCINDHAHNGKHMALLLPYKELGFSKEEFIKYRDNCWVQREWSASITPKGAFFCEIAGALDMLFNGPGGWPVEPGWWLREPKDFGKQLDWCNICSACLPVPHVEARQGIDIVSSKMDVILKKRGSKKQTVVVKDYDKSKYKANSACEPYLPDTGNRGRVASTNNTIKPKNIHAIIVCVNYSDYLDKTLYFNKNLLDKITIVTDSKDDETKRVCKKHGIDCIVSARIHENGAVFAKGKAINDALKEVKPTDWVLMMDADVILPSNFPSIKDYVLNPGVLYYTKRWGPDRIKHIPEFIDSLKKKVAWSVLKTKHMPNRIAKVEGRLANDVEHLPFGYFQLFNIRADALKGRKVLYTECSNTAEHDDKLFGFNTFYPKKVVSLPVPEFEVIHLPHGLFKENWEGRKSPLLKDAHKIREDEYVCVCKCIYRGRRYKPGDILKTDNLDVTKHFRRKG